MIFSANLKVKLKQIKQFQIELMGLEYMLETLALRKYSQTPLKTTQNDFHQNISLYISDLIQFVDLPLNQLTSSPMLSI